MADRFRALLQRLLEWWGRFSIKQKAAIISAAAVVILALSIAGYVFSRPVMMTIATATTAVESQNIQSLLEGEGIPYERSNDGMTYKIEEKYQGQANILLGSNGIPAPGFSITDVVDGSFSTTEADKQKKYQVYLEKKFASDISNLKNVKSAEINLHIPKDDGTLIANQEDTFANVILNLSDSMDTDQAAGLAKYIATGLGNEDTKRVTILDTNGNVLFSGGDEATSAGIASSNQKVKQEAERLAVNKVKTVLAGTGLGNIYDNVEVGINLDMNFDNTNIVDYDYYVHEGQTQGYLDSRTESRTNATNGVAGVPGTDANNDTTYVLQDNAYSETSSSDIMEDYLPSERITTTDGEVGVITYGNSTISVVAYNYVAYNEDDMKARGELDDTTFAEFVAANNQNVPVEVGDEIFQAVSNATRIPVENISILAYDVPMFNYSAGGRDWTDYLQIALAVLIIAMLGFVVLKTLRKEEEEEVEEEVSVEELMEEEQEPDLEAVRFAEKSEARIMIEKFVDERPQAVAQLLRNWLNEDWGE